MDVSDSGHTLKVVYQGTIVCSMHVTAYMQSVLKRCGIYLALTLSGCSISTIFFSA